jgi:hypothetical protein
MLIVVRWQGGGGDSVFVGPEASIIFGTAFKKKNRKFSNIKLSTQVNIYLHWEKKWQYITNFKNLTNTTNITKSKKNNIKHLLFNGLTHLYN